MSQLRAWAWAWRTAGLNTRPKKRKINRYWHLLLICVVSGTLFPVAQGAADSGDVSLQSLLDAGIQQVLDVPQWPCLYKGRFSQQRNLPGTQAVLKSSGYFLFSCHAGLLWETSKPVIETLVYTFAGDHKRVRSGGRVKVLSSPVQQRMAGLLLDLLGGDAAALQQDFNIIHAPLSNGIETINLQPKDAALARHLTKISLTRNGIFPNQSADKSEAKSLGVVIATSASGNIALQLERLRVQEAPAVVACAAMSIQADTTCQLLFNPDGR